MVKDILSLSLPPESRKGLVEREGQIRSGCPLSTRDFNGIVNSIVPEQLWSIFTNPFLQRPCPFFTLDLTFDPFSPSTPRVNSSLSLSLSFSLFHRNFATIRRDNCPFDPPPPANSINSSSLVEDFCWRSLGGHLSVRFAYGTSFCSEGKGEKKRGERSCVWRGCSPWRTLRELSLPGSRSPRFARRGHHPPRVLFPRRDNANCHPPLFRGPFVSLAPPTERIFYARYLRGSLQNAAAQSREYPPGYCLSFVSLKRRSRVKTPVPF